MKSILFIGLVEVLLVLSYKFPEKFERCHRNDPELDNCLKSTIQNALRLIGATGIPSLNLPSIDPLEITKLEIAAGTNAVYLIQKYSDVQLLGASSSIVENAHLDMDQKILTVNYFAPLVDQKGKYEIDGKVMVMPIYGKGDSDLILRDASFNHTIKFAEEIRNNKTFFKITTYKNSVIPKTLHFDFTNLFNGDDQLAANTLKVLNDNSKEIYEDVKESVESAYAAAFKHIAARFFSTVPVDEIFLN